MSMIRDGGYFGDPKPKPVPEQPTQCRGCGAALEPLRRYGGLCRQCVRFAARPVLAPTARVQSKLRVLTHFYRKRRDGRTEHFVRVRCTCGSERDVQWSTWKRRKPLTCARCRLRDVEREGFEAEHAR